MLYSWTKSLLLVCILSLCAAGASADANTDFEKGEAAYRKKDFTEAFFHLRKAAEAGHVEAQLYMGSMYRNDENGIEYDREKMFYWWNKAADQGNARAAHAVAQWSNQSFGEMVWPNEDYSELIPLYERAAKLGHASSQAWLADVYGKDQTVHADPDLHLYWVKNAAESGVPGSQFRLAEMYGQGEGMELDNEAALAWLEKAANNKHAKAQFHLARVYFIGMMGADKDNEKGLFWMQAAALNGEKPAYFELGMRHLTGDGVEKSPEKGRIYLQELMAKEDDKELRAQVAFKMGEIYALGGFGEASPVDSWAWFAVAKELGHPDAIRAFLHIDKQFGLSGLDKAKANTQAERCMETGYKICRPKNEAELARERELAEAIWDAFKPDRDLTN